MMRKDKVQNSKFNVQRVKFNIQRVKFNAQRAKFKEEKRRDSQRASALLVCLTKKSFQMLCNIYIDFYIEDYLFLIHINPLCAQTINI